MDLKNKIERSMKTESINDKIADIADLVGEKEEIVRDRLKTLDFRQYIELVKAVRETEMETARSILGLGIEEAEEYSDQQIKMAFGILNDPRYKQGNYSGAHAAIEKVAKGLASHPSVANALRRANESEVNEVRTMSLDSIDWPDSNMLQTATDAIRHDYTKNDAFSHLYSMHGDDHGKWLRANEDDILAMFSQYSMDESISEAEYEYDGKVAHISQDEFKKVHSDFKNDTPGEERMVILDPETGGTISVLVQFTDVNEYNQGGTMSPGEMRGSQAQSQAQSGQDASPQNKTKKAQAMQRLGKKNLGGATAQQAADALDKAGQGKTLTPIQRKAMAQQAASVDQLAADPKTATQFRNLLNKLNQGK